MDNGMFALRVGDRGGVVVELWRRERVVGVID